MARFMFFTPSGKVSGQAAGCLGVPDFLDPRQSVMKCLAVHG